MRYNRAAFAPPALGTYGDAGFFSVPGIATWTLDAAVSRQFTLTGDQRLEFRLEAFNVPNAVRAIDPTGIITNVNFGRITAVQQPRIMQFAVKDPFEPTTYSRRGCRLSTANHVPPSPLLRRRGS